MATVDRVSSLDSAYRVGDLSLYPEAKDTEDQLYRVSNNAETTLAKSLSYQATYVVAADAQSFPESGVIRVGEELVYYQSRTDNIFKNLARGFAGSRRNQWPSGTKVWLAVAAEAHNAVKDAIVNIQTNLGLRNNPAETSLNGILKSQETRFLAPKPLFRATVIKGAPPLTVKFQNLSDGDPIRFLWDFGDGATSVDFSPTHVYQTEGKYTVKLNMVTSLGAQGVVTKAEYIEVSNDNKPSFAYVTPAAGTTSTSFTFVDQTDGDIISRYWIWDDGNSTTILDPDVHTATHTYAAAGSYNPTLLVVFASQKLSRVSLSASIIVT